MGRELPERLPKIFLPLTVPDGVKPFCCVALQGAIKSPWGRLGSRGVMIGLSDELPAL